MRPMLKCVAMGALVGFVATISARCSAGENPDEMPVSVAGADAVPLVEGTGREGWSEVPTVLGWSMIYVPRKDQPHDGVVHFTVKKTGVIGLVASWAYDGNASGGWTEDRKSKQQLIDEGWREVGQMYRNLYDRHTVFFRHCKQGENFAVRTRKYNRPYVLIPNALTAPPERAAQPTDPNAVVEVPASEVMPAAELMTPEGTPEALLGTKAFVSPLSGVAIVRVQRRCLLYAAASWDYDGNRSGQWTEESWSKQKFLDEGWREIGTVNIKHRGSEQPHVLFVRECDKGDRFRLRTRKYGAPFVFVPPART